MSQVVDGKPCEAVKPVSEWQQENMRLAMRLFKCNERNAELEKQLATNKVEADNWACALQDVCEELEVLKAVKQRTVRSVFNNQYYDVMAIGSNLTSDGASREVVVLQAVFPNGLVEIVLANGHTFSEDYVNVY
jgi:hypothetical protein